MAQNNNTKYIAELWIENEKEEEFKRHYLKSLLEQWQHHTEDNTGFDADMVDGMHWQGPSGIKQYIDDSVAPLLSSFYIGQTYFSNKLERYFIGFEGVQLFGSGEAVYTRFPWEDDSVDYSGKDAPEDKSTIDLYHALEWLHLHKVDMETFNDLKTAFEELKTTFDWMYDAIADNIVDGQLSADAVNGISFWILTPEQYYERKYHDDPAIREEMKKPTNVWIIKDKEILEEYYPDGVYDGNPGVSTLIFHYEFRVASVQVEGEEEGVYEKYFQYRFVKEGADDEEGWVNVCKATDFLDPSAFIDIIKNLLENDDTYILNKTAFLRSLQRMDEPDNNTDMPLLNYIRKQFVHGAYYTLDNQTKTVPVKNGTADSPTANGNFRYLNLTELVDSLVSKITGNTNSINTLKERLYGTDDAGTDNGGTVNGKIKGSIVDIRSKIASNTQEINNIKNGDTNSIKKLNEDLTAYNNEFSSQLNKKVSKSIRAQIVGKFIPEVNPHTVFGIPNVGIMAYRIGNLGFLSVYMATTKDGSAKFTPYKIGKDGKKVLVGEKYEEISYQKISVNPLLEEFQPYTSQVWWTAPTWNNSNQTGVLKLMDTGHVYYRATYSHKNSDGTEANKGFNILDTFSYVCQGDEAMHDIEPNKTFEFPGIDFTILDPNEIIKSNMEKGESLELDSFEFRGKAYIINSSYDVLIRNE